MSLCHSGRTTLRTTLVGAVLAAALSSTSFGQTFDPHYANFYSLDDLGHPPSVPSPLGGLFIRADDPDTLYIGGTANSMAAKLYAVPVVRAKDGSIESFAGSGVAVLDLHGVSGGVDGGLQIGPGGVLFYTTYPDNHLGQVKAGSAGPDLLTLLTPLGVSASVGACSFVPPGFPGAGRLKLISYNSSIWYDTTVSPTGNGTYALGAISPGIQLIGGPEGIAYISAGNPQFSAPSVLICEYGAGSVVSYEVDGIGNPIVATKRPFLTGLTGAEGAAIDPLTGDFLFSTFNGGNRVVVVRGFSVPCPEDLDGDGVVGASDLAILLGAWGSVASPADLDGNGAVGASDLALLLGAWGTCAG